MNKMEFLAFCKSEFYKRGFKKVKNIYYFDGERDVVCGIHLQKSNYGEDYYVNVDFYIKGYNEHLPYPSKYEADIYKRIFILSKYTKKGEEYLSCQISYEKYSDDELRYWFDKAFEEWILPPLLEGKKFILDNLGCLYEIPSIRGNDLLKELQN